MTAILFVAHLSEKDRTMKGRNKKTTTEIKTYDIFLDSVRFYYII